MDTVDRIHELEKFGSMLGLERISRLLSMLGNPEKDLKCIHVAGTNGKGSVCMYIYEMLRAEGYKVGLYTSPFLEVFNERIQFDGRMITDEEVDFYTGKVFKAVDEMKSQGLESPTEFEVITAAAFLYYKEMNADYVVLEVGLGGRLDATNVITSPLVSVITSISFDHTERLGNTLALIAGEKAGIIKEGCPVVSSARAVEAYNVIKGKAEEKGCEFYTTRFIQYNTKYETINGSRFDVTILDKAFTDLEISMIGKHQNENAICALTAVLVMKKNGLKISDEAIYKGLKKAKQIGRYEVMSKEPLVIIDGAHNPDGARTLREATQPILRGKKILMVCGMLADKDTRAALSEFTKISKDFIVTTVPNPRKMNPNDLASQIEEFGRSTYIAAEPYEAIQLAEEMGRSFDATIYCGSLYLIGHIRSLMRGKKNV
ncbi:MAG: bifunctional folylpolyglutamate synthase/dihydrofolate synthase [Clostridia bacterium]|nr:bifunctional folylpolyglutamate synthase/dihydrofolate synthase [Clostridia bacterium]